MFSMVDVTTLINSMIMYYVILGCAFLVIVYCMFYFFMEWTNKECMSRLKLTGKTVIITGADKGIGFCTALDLARRNARVILACRDMHSASSAMYDIVQKTGNQQVFTRRLDLSSLKSVRQFAQEILEQENRIDVLINNAGIIGGIPFTRTEEGFEMVFVNNYLGHFLLTMLLLDKMKKCSPSRIINVSSKAHSYFGQLDFSNLNSQRGYNKAAAYSHSKLALILFSRELSKRLEGTGVTVNACHPGTVNSNFYSKMPAWLRLPFFNPLITRLFFKSAKTGAQTIIELAVAADVYNMTGCYFSNCRLATPAKIAMDDGAAKKLFDLSEGMAGVLAE